MRPAELMAVVRSSVERVTYPEVKAYLQDHLKPEFQELAMKLALIHVAERIVSLSSLEERREVLDTYPIDDGNLIGIRSEVKLGVQRLWKRRLPSPPIRGNNEQRRANTGAEGQRRVPSQGGLDFF